MGLGGRFPAEQCQARWIDTAVREALPHAPRGCSVAERLRLEQQPGPGHRRQDPRRGIEERARLLLADAEAAEGDDPRLKAGPPPAVVDVSLSPTGQAGPSHASERVDDEA